MSDKKKMSVAHRAVIKGIFGLEPDEFVTDTFQAMIDEWAKRVGHGHTDGTRLRYDDNSERWVTATSMEPAMGYVKNQMFIPDGPLGGIDIAEAICESSGEGSQDDGEVVKYCGCSNPRCNLPNSIHCTNPL